jgi:AraC-like DNA-binding protein
MTERLFLRLEDDPLYAPETTVPGGTMREFAVPAALRPFVAHAMAYDERLPDDREVVERVLPDGALRLIDLVDPTQAPRLVGPSARPVVLRMRGHIHGLSITLRPGASLALFGVPAHELAEEDVAWPDIAGRTLREHAARAHQAGSDEARAGILLEALLGSLRRGKEDESHMARQAATLFRAPASGERTVRAVAESLGLSERRLQQVFRAHVGLPPRTWSRLARLHDCLRLLRRPAPLPWHALALDGGFYDQSHLINEFQALCGMTPEQFLNRGVSGSSKTGA